MVKRSNRHFLLGTILDYLIRYDTNGEGRILSHKRYRHQPSPSGASPRQGSPASRLMLSKPPCHTWWIGCITGKYHRSMTIKTGGIHINGGTPRGSSHFCRLFHDTYSSKFGGFMTRKKSRTRSRKAEKQMGIQIGMQDSFPKRFRKKVPEKFTIFTFFFH